ncbi:MAG: cytochrome P450 [Halioglobus sp.]|nr:cytochrome P450 [Halioglobus sp.]
MSEGVMHADASAPELRPIAPGFFSTWRLLRQLHRNPLEHAQEMRARHGDAVMQKFAGMTLVHLYGADAHQLALQNRGEIFSNKKAWDLIIGRIFPNGLMLRDGDDHRYHRRLMQAGFKNKAMQRYLLEMVPQVEAAVGDWPVRADRPLAVYPTFKKLTLDLAATIFLGMDLGEEADRVNGAFETAVAASMPVIRLAIPGTLLWRGIRARRYMCEYFMKQIPAKREGSGTDLFSLLCQATDEEGNAYTDQEVVDHIIFLMMAAHDTTTSTLTSMTYALARHPEWQQRLFEEMESLGVEHLRYEDLERLEQTEWVMKEALRMYPPLSSLPKYSLKPFDYGGVRVPAGVMVATYPIHTHYMEEYWSQPGRFDPLRFSDERAEHKRHPYCWVPFSGGAHMCIGLHFAIMQIKLVMFEMVRRYRWRVADGYEMPVQQAPISKPRDDLPVYFEPRGCAGH